MATWTAKEISDLNNSMVAAQNPGLGTVVAALEAEYDSYKVRSGSVVPNKQRYPVATGLTTVTRAVVSFSGSPVPVSHLWSYAVAGSVAGDILLYQYGVSTSASIALPVVSTGSSVDAFAQLTWFAIGS